DTNWHHIVAYKDGTSSIGLYVDGRLDATDTSLTTTGDLLNGRDTVIGDRDALDNGDEFLGDIDEVKVYHYVLTTAEVNIDRNGQATQVLGALSDKSTNQPNSATNEFCVPGDSTSCAAPILEWRLDEKTGTNVSDTSGSGKTGTITTGTSSKWISGKFGGAYDFGTSTSGGKAQSASSFSTFTTVTEEAWIYPRTMGEGNVGRINGIGTGGSPQFRFDFSGTASANNLRFTAFFNSGTTNINWTTPSASITMNAWSHVAVTYDGSSTSTNPIIYINGVPQTLTETTSGSPSGSISSLSNVPWVAGNGTGQGSTFVGRIDQARVFDYIRTPAQIKWGMDRGGAIAHWKIDECQGTTINDSSGNSLSGTLTVGASGEDTVGTCATSSTAWGNGVTGKLNYSIDVDGTDDYIEVSDPSSGVLDPIYDSIDSDFALSGWFYRDSATTDDTIIAKRDGLASGDTGYIVYIDDSTDKVTLEVSDGTDEYSLESSSTFT
ncbi:hypothetical protein HY419_00730, partial [candidate division WWE3 bacterium]|nr:hypothetical protein [candidate division WWE3 bacterium]